MQIHIFFVSAETEFMYLIKVGIRICKKIDKFFITFILCGVLNLLAYSVVLIFSFCEGGLLYFDSVDDKPSPLSCIERQFPYGAQFDKIYQLLNC